MDDIIDMLDNIIENKNWSSEVFVEKIAEFAAKQGIEDELVDFMLGCEVESITEDSFD